ncbi:MAG: hypothetical protein RBS99_16705 [Rhodospirillales bacterium]|jgi:hypothetical protein|nr:hypothetical protein [Rhodospirillales bacterium]
MADSIEGFTVGEPQPEPVLCTGCWDNSDHDTNADNDIPAGAPIYYRQASVEYDEWNAYCEKCARAEAVFWAGNVSDKRTGGSDE